MELKYIKGLSDKRIQELKKLGILSAEDLLRLFPRDYLDMRNSINLKYVQNNDFALTRGRIVSIPEYAPTRSKYSYFKVLCEQDGEPFTIIWFNQPYVKAKLKEGEEYLFYGRVRNKFGITMTNPSFEIVDNNINLKGIVPVYPIKGLLSQKIVRSIIADALNKVTIHSIIPENFIKKYSLASLETAFKIIHQPQNFLEIEKAAERIAIEEYFLLISAFKFIKGGKEQARVNRYNVNGSELKEFAKRFPFEFTEGQKQAVNEIYTDLKQPILMNRLLQGDVGCGKTAVALCAIYIAVKSGYQVAMLAPTEVLARQNLSLIEKYFKEYKVCFLSGSLSVKQKKLLKEKIISGEANIVVGTHAILENDVQFKNLSLCICDEQQRFGVAQRNKLVEKGNAADVLIMSATPIPRTLSLIFYGDLDITTIKDKPTSRVQIKTNIVPARKYNDMLKFIQNEVDLGHQIYFICPKIDGDEEGSVMSVTELYEELSAQLPLLKIDLLHGRMKEDNKSKVMSDFKEGITDAIVSTTVIEVGVDVPNASVICIFSADRFGLSQLHQLRGRVGRGDVQSYCFLLSDNESESTLNRLKAMKDNSDGFKISEIDFDERGGGDFLGTRQSGKMMTDLGALKYSSSAIFVAKKLADDFFANGENVSFIKNIALSKYNKLKDVILN